MFCTIEQRAAIYFCWKATFNATKTFEIIQKVYGESAVHRVTVFRWYNSFSEGQESICDNQTSGRLTTTRPENIACVTDILKEDRLFLYRLKAKQCATKFTQRFTETEILHAVCAACIDSQTERTAPQSRL